MPKIKWIAYKDLHRRLFWAVHAIALGLLLQCTSRENIAIHDNQVEIALETGQFLTGWLFEPVLKEPTPSIIMQLEQARPTDASLQFAGRIARLGYHVLILESKTSDDAESSEHSSQTAFEAAVKFMRLRQSVLAEKIGLFAIGTASVSAILTAASDSLIAEVVVLGLTPRKNTSDLLTALPKIPPRPLVLIAPMQSPNLLQQETQDFYQAISEPKKLVWLATDRYDASLLASDLEPVVRRIIVLLSDRYLKVQS